MSLEFLCQGYNKANQKCFSFTLEKVFRKTKYIYVRYSENTRVSYYNDAKYTISTMKPMEIVCYNEFRESRVSHCGIIQPFNVSKK